MVKVDASYTRVDAVLSQHATSDEEDKLHPCAFYSHQLTSTEKNDDVGSWELPAVKPWRNGGTGMEGAEHPFLVWADHKNLSFIQSAKRLNSRQARWALFFGQFRFTLTYLPSFKNGKQAVLS